MRISDWSSDVCSSDLLKQGKFLLPAGPCMPVALPAPLPAPTAVRRDGILASVAKEFEQPIEIARDQQAVQCNEGIELLHRAVGDETDISGQGGDPQAPHSAHRESNQVECRGYQTP